MNVKVEDKSDEAIDAMNSALFVALEKCGFKAEDYAKKICPVDTSRLKTSITHAVAVREKATYIGTNVKYAPDVELGTIKQKAQPYLRPAVEDHGKEYQNIVKNAMKGD